MTGGKFALVSITLAVDSDDNIRVLTVKRPKFDILFGEKKFFLQNLFR